MIHVFCPEEPELIVYIDGRFLRFQNTRLDLADDAPGSVVGFFRNQTQPDHSGRFIVSDSLVDPAVSFALMRRISGMVARKANAQNPTQAANDAQFLLSVALSRGAEYKPITGDQAMRTMLESIGQAMPGAVKELEPITGYTDRQAEKADAAAIEAGLNGIDPEALSAVFDTGQPAPETGDQTEPGEAGPSTTDSEIPGEIQFFPPPAAAQKG